jgi:hypothetical protein
MLAKPRFALSIDAMTEKRKQNGSSTLQHNRPMYVSGNKGNKDL